MVISFSGLLIPNLLRVIKLLDIGMNRLFYVISTSGFILSLGVIGTHVLQEASSEKRVIFQSFIAIYVYFYAKNYGKTPTIISKPGSKLDQMLRCRMNTFKRRYMPLYWCPGSWCQIILRTILPCLSNVEYRREAVEVADGGLYYLDWCDNHDNKRFPDPSKRPTVFILPGVTSTSKASYIKSMVSNLKHSGYRIMVIVNRGLDGMTVKSPKPYCPTDTQDIDIAIQLFRRYFPDSKLFAVGCSLGSLTLGKYLSQKEHESCLEAAMLVNCPFNATACVRELEIWTNKTFFNGPLTQKQKEVYIQNSQIFEGLVDHQKIVQSSHTREFDEHFSAPIFGYKNADDYYSDLSLDTMRLSKIKIPVLCLNSNDDPFSPEHALPKSDICNTENIALVVTHGGGHVSHFEGFNPYSRTYLEKVMTEYFDVVSQEV